MTQHGHRGSKSGASSGGGSFWKSRAGITPLVFFGAAGLLLAYEYRAHIVTSDGLLIGLLALCIVVHLSMHGGGHGGRGWRGSGRRDE